MKLQDMTTIYFACMGNTCRSPTAQRILMEYLPEKNIKSRTCIEGTHLFAGQRLADDAAKLIREHYGDEQFIQNHRSKNITLEELKEADIIITMEAFHKDFLIREPEAWTDGKCKVYSLGELVGKYSFDVEDPSPGDVVHLNKFLPKKKEQTYENMFQQLRTLIQEALQTDIPPNTIKNMPLMYHPKTHKDYGVQ
jgi:protein-tyrosine-phosphatase